MPAALVTGTFNPPHMGHVKLIKAAIEKRDHVVVIVLAQPHDRFSAELRARALEQDCIAEGVAETAMTIVHGYESTPYDPSDPAVTKSNARVIEAHLRHTIGTGVSAARHDVDVLLAERVGHVAEQSGTVDGNDLDAGPEHGLAVRLVPLDVDEPRRLRRHRLPRRPRPRPRRSCPWEAWRPRSTSSPMTARRRSSPS